jgi:hypothetical protein
MAWARKPIQAEKVKVQKKVEETQPVIKKSNKKATRNKEGGK